MTCTVPRRMQLSKQGVDPWMGPHDSQATRKCPTHNTKSHKPAGRNFNIRGPQWLHNTSPPHRGVGVRTKHDRSSTGFDSLQCAK
jgi:hypothetical protein